MQQYVGVRCVASCVLQVCGARSCPPINVYQAATLELSLDFATRAFFSDPASFRIETSTRVPTVWLSKILCWYVVWTQECGVVGWVVCLVHSPLPAVRCHCLLCGAIAASRVACRRVDVHRYSSDFGADSTAILRWIRPFLMSDVQSVLDGVMRKGSVKVDHVPYDWSVNSK